MNRTIVVTALVLLSTTLAACGKNTPAPAEKKDAKNDAEKKESYFKNPAPPFEVVLGEAEKESPAAEFLDSGHLRLPLLYREWVFIGSRLVAGTQSEFENYYMHPRHYHKFRQDHAWPAQIVLVRERIESKPTGADVVMGEPRGVSAAVYSGYAEGGKPLGWFFFDFGESYPLANSAPPDGRAWFDSPDALLEFCPVLRGIKR